MADLSLSQPLSPHAWGPNAIQNCTCYQAGEAQSDGHIDSTTGAHDQAVVAVPEGQIVELNRAVLSSVLACEYT